MVNDVRQAVHTAESLVSEPSAFEVETAIEKLKRHKSPGIDQIPAEFIRAGGRKIRSEIHKLIKSIRGVIKQTVVIIEAYLFCQLLSKVYPSSCCQC